MKKVLLSFVLIFVFSFSAFSDDFVCTTEYLDGKKIELDESVTYKRINNDSYNIIIGQDQLPFDITHENEFILVVTKSYAESNEASLTMSTIINKYDLTFGYSIMAAPYNIKTAETNTIGAGNCIKL